MTHLHLALVFAVGALLSGCGRNGGTQVDKAYCTPDGKPSGEANPTYCMVGLQKWLESHPGVEVISVAAPSSVRVVSGNTGSFTGTTELVVVFRPTGK